MNHGDAIPGEHRIAIYCSGSQTIPKGPDGDRLIAPQAFQLAADERERSGHHWEHDPEVTKAKHIMRRIRSEADGPDGYTRRPTGRYARLKVADIHGVGYGLSVKKIDGGYESHVGICGLDRLHPENALDVWRNLVKEIQRVFPGVTNRQPRNDR